METSKKSPKLLIIALLIAALALIIMIIAVILLAQHKSSPTAPDASDPSTTPDTSISSDPNRDNHIIDPAGIVEKLMAEHSDDPTIKELSDIYSALEAGNTGSAGNYLSNIDASSLEGDTAIFYYYNTYLYNSAVGNSDAAASAKLEIDRQSTKSHFGD